MKLTKEHVRMLTKLERDMDSGVQPFVLLGGARLSIGDEELAEFGLECGQTISNYIYRELLDDRLRKCQVDLAAKRFEEEA